MAIAPKFERLSEEQQNDARVAVQNFIRRHDISDWSVQVNVQETTTGTYSVRIEITPPVDSGLSKWPVQEFAVAGATFDVAAEVDRLLELGWQDHLQRN